MPAPSPSSLFDALFDRVGQALQPPAWVVEEMQRRLVLLLNHVLQQEPEAQVRLQRQAGRVVEAHWRIFSLRLIATPAGLLDLAAPSAMPDLTLTVTEDSPWQLAQAALRGDRPPVRIAGDVQLAAEVQWLVDHVRWDLEEDLARVIGDAPAHGMAQMAGRMAEALRRFVGGAAAAASNPVAAAATVVPTPGSGNAGSAAFVPPNTGAPGSGSMPPGAPAATSGTPSAAAGTGSAAGPQPQPATGPMPPAGSISS